MTKSILTNLWKIFVKICYVVQEYLRKLAQQRGMSYGSICKATKTFVFLYCIHVIHELKNLTEEKTFVLQTQQWKC
jgi:hypothetical protein